MHCVCMCVQFIHVCVLCTVGTLVQYERFQSGNMCLQWCSFKALCGHSIQVAADHATYTCTARISTVSACLIEQAAVNAPFDAEKRKVCRFLRLFLRWVQNRWKFCNISNRSKDMQNVCFSVFLTGHAILYICTVYSISFNSACYTVYSISF